MESFENLKYNFFGRSKVIQKQNVDPDENFYLKGTQILNKSYHFPFDISSFSECLNMNTGSF